MPQPNFKSRQIGFALRQLEAAGKPISGPAAWHLPTHAPIRMCIFSAFTLVVNRRPAFAALPAVTFIGE
jgi:hypothetical protein